MAARFGAPIFVVWSPPAMTGPAAGWLKKCLLDLFSKRDDWGNGGSALLNECLAVVVVIHILLVKNGNLDKHMFL